MTDTIYLSRPALLSALGNGLSDTLANLLTAPDRLSQEKGMMADADRVVTVGRVHTSLCELPSTTPDHLRSRNNQLLETALVQMHADIERLLAQYERRRIAVVIGTSTTGSDENEVAFRAVSQGANWQDVPFCQKRQLLAQPALYIAQKYDLQSLAYSLSTACTSGAKALISAARMLRAGLADAVICGGVDNLSRFTLNGFDSLSVLSDAPCQPFGSSQGINIGEGAALFIATREPLQQHDEALILSGYGASSDAYHMSTPRPDGAGAKAVMQQALATAHCTPADIGWINAHGTGTSTNDAMEALAIAEIFSKQTPVTSTKSFTGHCLGAAGAVEAAIAWGIASANSNPLGKLPSQGYAHPDITLTTADSQLKQRRVLSNSFAFGGNNAALIIEQRLTD